MWQNGFFFITGFILGRYYNNKPPSSPILDVNLPPQPLILDINSPPPSPILDINSPPPSPILSHVNINSPELQTEQCTYKELRAYAKFLGIPEFHKMKFDDLKYAVSKYI